MALPDCIQSGYFQNKEKNIAQNDLDDEIINNFTVGEISRDLNYLASEDQTRYINLALAKLSEEDKRNRYFVLSQREFN